jgi:nitrogenase molybdenum-iron protein alpha/beta subunit
MTAIELPAMRPDGLTGAILAAEGIRDAAVLLNGPTGCKYYHGALSDGQLPRQNAMDPLQYSDEFYFGQPRVPATYLDDHDYIFGATEKLDQILPRVAEKGHALIVVVNSPGAALIGDDLERFIAAAGLPVPCVAIESAGFSEGFARGFQQALIRLLQRLPPAGGPGPAKRVNLLGFSIFQRHWDGNTAELGRLLGLCGIGVQSVLCAGCRTAELAAAGGADANLVVHPEMADQVAGFLESRFGLPALTPADGAPIGFAATRGWIEGVCEALGADPAPALAELRRAQNRAYETLSRFNSLTGLPKAAGFALRADGSVALPLTQWLYDYLGMVPVAVALEESTPGQAAGLRAYLEGIGCADAWQAAAAESMPDVVFGGEDFIGGFRARGLPVVGIDLALPARAGIELIPRCSLGAAGALWLLERILNGMLETG